MQIIDGKQIAQEYKDELKAKVAQLKRTPTLAVILANDDEASTIYVRNKVKAGAYIGINVEVLTYNSDVTEQELIAKLTKLNNDANIDGIIIQSPIYSTLDEEKLCNMISPSKDVDGFGFSNLGYLALNQEKILSATPLGIIKLLEHEHISIEGKHVVIVGRSKIVGRPLALALLNRNATISIAHSKTKDLKALTSQADILITAIGQANYIKEDFIKDQAVVIDVGINRIDGKIMGDCDFENLKNKCSYITPVPGGVGPMTVAMLFNNVYESAKRKEER